jgi:hypothetical protein
MSYVIYNLETTRIFRNKRTRKETYKTAAAARAAMTRNSLSGDEFWFAEVAFFHDHIEKQVERRNLMSGKTFTQPINTPLCCDPSSETYWSM